MLSSLPKLIALVSMSFACVAGGSHPHQGVVAPFASGDPGVKLNGSALQTLRAGKPHSTQIQSETGGRGLVVQDVHAPSDVVWAQILDFGAYPKMVPKTAESEIYGKEKLRGGQERIWVRMKVGFPMFKLHFYINHLYDPSHNSLTWTLDYSKKSDLNDSVGFWYVVPHPDNPKEWTRVYYSVEISVFPWMPQFVVDFMGKKALLDATAWVKKHSELVAPTSSLAQDVPSVQHQRPNLIKRLFGGKKPAKIVEDPQECDVKLQEPKNGLGTTIKAGFVRYGLVIVVLLLIQLNLQLYLGQ